MDENLEFAKVEGEKKPCDIQIYALSTCGFCRRALAFLRNNKITFRYIYVDQLSYDLRQKIKRNLMAKFEQRIGFPFAVIDDGEKVLVGFTETKYEEAFLQ